MPLKEAPLGELPLGEEPLREAAKLVPLGLSASSTELICMLAIAAPAGASWP